MPSKPTEPKTTRNKFVLNNLLAKRRKPKSGLLDSATSLAQEQIDRTHSFADFVADELSKKPDAEKQAELAKLSAPVGQLIRALMVKGKRLARNPKTKSLADSVIGAGSVAAIPATYEYASGGGISTPLAEWITGSPILKTPGSGQSMRVFDPFPGLEERVEQDPVNGVERVKVVPTKPLFSSASDYYNPRKSTDIRRFRESNDVNSLSGLLTSAIPAILTKPVLANARNVFIKTKDPNATLMSLAPAMKNKLLAAGALGAGPVIYQGYRALQNAADASQAIAGSADELRSRTGEILGGTSQTIRDAGEAIKAFGKTAPEIGGAASGIRDMSKQIGEASSEMSGAIKPLGEAATAARPALEQMGPALNALAETPDQLSRGLTTASGDIRSGLESATNTIGSNLSKFENTLKYLGFGALGVGGTYLVLKKLLEYKAAKDREVTRRAALARPQTKSKKVTIDPGDYLIDVKDPTPA